MINVSKVGYSVKFVLVHLAVNRSTGNAGENVNIVNTGSYMSGQFKMPFCSQLINFLKNFYLRNCHTYKYIIITDLYEEICVEFERKNDITLVLLLSNCLQILTNFND